MLDGYECVTYSHGVFTKAERAVLRKIGKRNGKLGGRARAEKLSQERRIEIARAAAQRSKSPRPDAVPVVSNARR